MADNTITFFSCHLKFKKFTSLRPFEKKQSGICTYLDRKTQAYLLTLMRALYLQVSLKHYAVDSSGFIDTAVSLHVKTE